MLNINTLIKNATLSHDKVALNAYKNLKAEFQKIQTSKNYKGEWTEQLELQTINKYAKSLEDAILQFSEARRDDLVAEYTSELEVVKKLLPEPVDALQICSELSKWCVENNFCSEIEEFIIMPEGTKSSGRTLKLPKKEMGNAIKYLKSKFPIADGKMISEIVKKYIV